MKLREFDEIMKDIYKVYDITTNTNLGIPTDLMFEQLGDCEVVGLETGYYEALVEIKRS